MLLMFTWIKSLFNRSARIHVSIPVDTSLPSRSELAARNEIADELNEMGFGTLIRAGNGFNQMDFTYEVTNASTAKGQLETVIKKHLPGKDYRITIE